MLKRPKATRPKASPSQYEQAAARFRRQGEGASPAKNLKCSGRNLRIETFVPTGPGRLRALWAAVLREEAAAGAVRATPPLPSPRRPAAGP